MTPAQTRFRPGQSGNPSGRPKRRPTFQDALLAELARATPGNDADRTHSKLQALVRTLVDSAIAGNARAQSVVVGALARIGDAEESESPSLTPDDREILDAYVGGELERRAAAEDDTPTVATERPADRQHYQQDVDAQALPPIRPDHFGSFTAVTLPYGPVVLSIDPGVTNRKRSAYSVIQAWQLANPNYFLLYHFREQIDFAGLRDMIRHFRKRCRPVAILIERAANGHALISDLTRKFGDLIIPVDPDGRSKAARLGRHAALIIGKRIWLPADAEWRDDFIDEFVAFPNGKFTDQVDATTRSNRRRRPASPRWSPALVRRGWRRSHPFMAASAASSRRSVAMVSRLISISAACPCSRSKVRSFIDAPAVIS